MARAEKTRGLARSDVLVVVAVALFLLALVPVIGQRARGDARQATCMANLSRLGKAMLVYASDYEDEFPRAGGRNSVCGYVRDWMAPNRFAAYGLDITGSGGRASISSCFYLLVKYGEVPPQDFLCPGDAGSSAFSLAGRLDIPPGVELIDCWDFGPAVEAPTHCSYSYHAPFGVYALTTASDPRMAVAADRNPWIRSPGWDAKQFSQFRPDLPEYNGSAEQARQGNAMAHQEDGQNVLFVDGHVEFAERAYCGLENDNVYTVSTRVDGGDPLGSVAASWSSPMARKDSLLIHDEAIAGGTRANEAENVDSRTLRQTTVVATLDCPLLEHKNAIWCSTFQMAWDGFKEDLIGEPIEVLGAEELANRLNQNPFPVSDIEPQSYCTAAGFVKDGIIEQIQKDMAARFPSEPLPVFDDRYTTLPAVALAYAYLNVDLGFRYPFYANNDSFAFSDSNGTLTDVVSFCAHAAVPNATSTHVREQVEILHYGYGDTRETDEFAVDLCRYTQPYQVILARVPCCATLGAAAQAVQEKIAAFKDDPHYETLRTLRPIDSLIVPDILYKLTHHFEELLGKHLGNVSWRRYFIFDALQTIDFALGRTGVILKSEARLSAGTSRVRQVQEPRRLHFNRPFLICVRKRDADAEPFFIMWVDNAELMKKYGGHGSR